MRGLRAAIVEGRLAAFRAEFERRQGLSPEGDSNA
jgi:hypothetical protein